MASIAPVTDSIKSFVFLAGGTGGCGRGGGGLDGSGFPFFDGGVTAVCVGCGGLTTVGGFCIVVVVVVIVIVVAAATPNKSTSADVTKMSDGWLVKTLVAGVSVVVASNPSSGRTLSMPKEANGLVESTDAGGGSYVSSLLKFRNGFSPAPEVPASEKSWRKGLELCGGAAAPPNSVA